MSILRKILSKFGYILEKDGLRINHIRRRMLLINNYNIDLVFDVGANLGQYALGLIRNDYHNRIVSFEPLNDIFVKLEKETRKYPLWEARNYALGHVAGEVNINVSGHSDSSSLLDMLPIHEQLRFESKYIGTERIKIFKLDDKYQELIGESKNPFLKIDAQGYEFNILEGSKSCMEKLVGLQLELSFAPLYRDERTLCEMIEYVKQSGFELMSLEPGTIDPKSGRMFQVDGIFFRK